MSAITPKEMSREDWLKHVGDAYQTLRRYNHSIPDEVLDAMRDRLLDAPESVTQFDEMQCRQAYENTYHKVRAEIGYDDWLFVWKRAYAALQGVSK